MRMCVIMFACVMYVCVCHFVRARVCVIMCVVREQCQQGIEPCEHSIQLPDIRWWPAGDANHTQRRSTPLNDAMRRKHIMMATES